MHGPPARGVSPLDLDLRTGQARGGLSLGARPQKKGRKKSSPLAETRGVAIPVHDNPEMGWHAQGGEYGLNPEAGRLRGQTCQRKLLGQ